MIQIDMEMPKNCLDCNLRYQSFCSVDGHHEPHLEKERCPLKVTPQEPKTGHWVDYEVDSTSRSFGYKKFHCSNCNSTFSGINVEKTDYCPNCGCRMV